MTPAQIMTRAEASRTNGAKSNGPVTPEGRAISAQNARKHGLTGAGSVVLPHESQEEYDLQLGAFIDQYNPVGPVELGLVNEIVSTRWRLSRMLAMEAALFETAIEEQRKGLAGGEMDSASIDAATSRAYADVAENSKGFRLLMRYEKELRRKYEKALIEFEKIQEERTSRNEPEPEPEPDYSSLKDLVASQSIRPVGDFLQAVKPYLHQQQVAPAAPMRKSAA